MKNRTLGLIKPQLAGNKTIIDNVEAEIRRHGLEIIATKHFKPSKSQLERFYADHKGKFFYDRLILTMGSGDVRAYILEGENVITKWRELIGPTKLYLAKYSHPDTFRSKFGLSDTRNGFHGSGNENEAINEINVMFDKY
ncbi:nucleoside diphosphate kinase [Wallemia mellicola CBS 633.66]|uniref:Nucleoside diphosphate kinase n=1 Tax=Wallemia mellicola (strain ATCC MYA-4683 / CBS 633.66) TaxID=671144 RepID=I4YI12_WALMC|nr:nucleoside diphosphate kinase [Wallemia mellicola CBS 633.66]EIM23604.1 nucleoside diphosphate kinase [Wallemia mellicola CBS 633.66]|eukprot:XP_006956275.1 nucleoside diphosphate kinase [Wallemia mellicola CBS 633.66]